MADLKEQIKHYIATRNEFLGIEERVMREIRDAFDQEIPALNKKLPADYAIERYEVLSPEKFQSKIHGDRRHTKPRIIFPYYGLNSEVDKRLSFNVHLSDEYWRIEEKIGVIIEGFKLVGQFG